MAEAAVGPTSSSPVGLLAGWGRLPIVVAKAVRAEGREVYCLGADGHADPELADICTHFDYVGLAKFGRIAKYFRRHGVHEATMCGKIHKRIMFQPGFLRRMMPDWTTIRLFAPHFLWGRKDRKDDTILLDIVNYFAGQGVRFVPATDYAPELLVKSGVLTRRQPTASQWRDIRFGWELAKEMGRLDVGQSVVVKNQAAIAIEAIEGTDECIRRSAPLCKAGGFTVVKVAKPQQDMRFDVPTIGLKTLESIIAGGGSVLAVEAEMTIALDQEELAEFADKNRLTIVAVTQERIDAIE